ncbi:MAG: FGGY-family carbohydrate kinase [Candidatus Bathyarchaeia archaeon]
MKGPYLIGVDVGTTGCKAMLFDIEGNLISKEYKEWSVIVPKPGWVEQDPECWWKNISLAIREIVKNINCEDIAGLAISGLSPTVIPIDKEGKVLRPAIIWMDQRATNEANFLSEKIGQKINAADLASKIFWVKRNEPKIYEKTYKLLQSYDFINFKLTGEIKSAMIMGRTRPVDEDLLRLMEISLDIFPDPVPIGTVIGEVTAEAAEVTGLNKGTKVVAAAVDVISAILGSGAVKPGRVCDRGGTSQGFNLCWNEPVFDPQRRIGCWPHVVTGLYNISGVMSTTGASLRWFRDNLATIEMEISKKLNVDAYEILNIEAERSPPGSNNLIFLPYMMGERSPIHDPYARGVFFGLSLNHKREHLIRAIMEGVAYGMRHIMEIIESFGPQVKEIRLTGGQAKSRVWSQIKADVLGKPVIRLIVSDAEAVGSAIIAGVGVRIFKDIVEASEKMVRIAEVIKPRNEYYEKYTKLFEIYKEIYLNLKDTFRKLSICK